MQKNFSVIKKMKKRTYDFTCDFEGLDIDLSEKTPFKISLTKKQMDITLENLLNNRSNFNAQQSIKNIINKTLEDNDLSPSDIDCIYLTGGMANYDQISKTIILLFKPVIVADAPLFCTATGVALSLVIQTPEGTSEIAKNVKSQLKNKSSHSNQKANTEEISAKKYRNNI